MHFSTWNVDASQILSRQELAAVLKDLKRRAARLPNVQMNLAIVRLACCCGLRASEIGGLTLGDVRVGIARPHLMVRAEHAKLNRPRRIPLWWDAGTLADLAAWLDERYDQGATRDDPFVCSLQTATLGQPLNRHVLRRRFHTACRVLGWDRLRNLTIHHGRHTFISHALAGGRTLAEVKAAAGHASLLTTSVYLHVVVDEREEVGALFELEGEGNTDEAFAKALRGWQLAHSHANDPQCARLEQQLLPLVERLGEAANAKFQGRSPIKTICKPTVIE